MNIIYRPKSITIKKEVVLSEGILAIGLKEWLARSGGYGKGSLPHGEYLVEYYVVLEDIPLYKAYKKDSFPWYVNLVPQFKTERDEFLIHPDGNVPGTEGCVGIMFNDLEFFTIVKAAIRKGEVVKLTVL